MNFMRILILFCFVQTFFVSEAFPAGSVPAVDNRPTVGRKAAAKYFEEDSRKNLESPTSESPTPATGGILMLHIGQYTESHSYRWSPSGSLDGVGQANYGVTYLYDSFHRMDTHIRADFSEYSLADERAVKLAVLSMLTFPGVETKFPLYFGLGAGLGVFFQQLKQKSNLSLDYEAIMGLRFLNIGGSTVGAFAEFGMKNHILLLSEGQFNGTNLSAGVVFSF